jgi:hypothetical protein
MGGNDGWYIWRKASSASESIAMSIGTTLHEIKKLE